MLKSVGSRLLVIMLAITITGMGLIAVIGSFMTGNALIEETLGRISEATSHDADNIDRWFVQQNRYIEAVANDISAMSEPTAQNIYPALVRHAETNAAYFAVYAGFPDGTAVFSDDWVPDYNVWRANERDWYKGAVANPDVVYITDLYQDADTGNLCLTFSKAIINNGRVLGVVAADVFTDVLFDIISNTNVGEQSYANLTDGEGNIIFHSSNEYSPVIDDEGEVVFHNITEIENGYFTDLRSQEILFGGDSVKLTGLDGITRYYTAAEIDTAGWFLYTAIPVSVVEAPVRGYQIMSVLVLAIVTCVTVTLIYFNLRKMITRPVKDVTNAANLIARGEKVKSLGGNYIGEIALLADSFRGMEAFNDQQSKWLEQIAGGDLSIHVSPRGDNDYIGQSIKSMLDNLNEMFFRIDESTHQVASGSKQIATGSQTLAHGSEEQAAAIQQLSSSMIEISEKTKQNAEVAYEAAKLSNDIRSNAEQGNIQMEQMVRAVKEINEASKSIGNVIKTIDEIAFQTQILALNAAVEAARAGHHGKGFTVVADEVRNLAQKSAEAAQNTSALIENSILKANLGLDIAHETANSLDLIVDGINRSSAIAAQIVMSSDDQIMNIAQINESIDRVADVVQQNSATAEESAAASTEMSHQADKLELLISKFKLRH